MTDSERIEKLVQTLNKIKNGVSELSKPEPTLEKYWGAGYLVAIEKVLEIIKKSENETLDN